MFPNFLSVNTPTMADFRLPTWHHGLWSWEEMQTITLASAESSPIPSPLLTPTQICAMEHRSWERAWALESGRWTSKRSFSDFYASVVMGEIILLLWASVSSSETEKAILVMHVGFSSLLLFFAHAVILPGMPFLPFTYILKTLLKSYLLPDYWLYEAFPDYSSTYCFFFPLLQWQVRGSPTLLSTDTNLSNHSGHILVSLAALGQGPHLR